jgi:hypothetical protein
VSLPPIIFRDIGDEVPASDKIIYRAFVRHLTDNGTSAPRAILRAAADCGVPRSRVIAVVRAHGDAGSLLDNPSYP